MEETNILIIWTKIEIEWKWSVVLTEKFINKFLLDNIDFLKEYISKDIDRYVDNIKKAIEWANNKSL